MAQMRIQLSARRVFRPPSVRHPPRLQEAHRRSWRPRGVINQHKHTKVKQAIKDQVEGVSCKCRISYHASTFYRDGVQGICSHVYRSDSVKIIEMLCRCT